MMPDEVMDAMTAAVLEVRAEDPSRRNRDGLAPLPGLRFVPRDHDDEVMSPRDRRMSFEMKATDRAAEMETND